MGATNPPRISMPSLRRIAARDRRRAAMHEAAHVIVARHLGFCAWAHLEPARVSDPFCEKLWTGKARIARLDRPPTQRDFGMIAVAGAIAEAYWQGDTFEDITEGYFWEDADIMSDTDWACAGCPAGCPTDEFLSHVDESAKLLDPETGGLWPKVIQKSRYLMKFTR
jgi:hypothetical protein